MILQHQAADDFGLARHRRAGLYILLGLGVVVLGWGLLARIAGAVISPGQVVVESSAKQVQHREGGIVSDILVHNGDSVSAGQVLIRLESEVSQASATTAADQLAELMTRRMRLEAERDGRDRLVAAQDGSPSFLRVVNSEQLLLKTRAAERAQRQAQLDEQVVQAQEQIKGSQAQVAAIEAQIDLMRDEVQGMRALHEKGFAPLSTLNRLERDNRQLIGERERLTAQISQSRARIAEIQLKGGELDTQFRSEVMTELKDTNLRIAQIQQQKTADDDVLRRDEIRAPSSGTVQEIAVHTRGGVIGPGQVLMVIVPQKETLVVESRVDPQHVDQVRIGAKANIRFTSFQSNTTPEIVGRVERVSADAQVDPKTGQPFYSVRCEFKGAELPRQISSGLIPGMPAEVHIQTGSRMALSYFLKPLTDQMKRTFREE